MNAKECKYKLSEFFSKGEKKEEMQKHIAACEKCRFVFEKIQTLAPEKIRPIDESPEPYFLSKCEAKLDNALEKEESFNFFPKRKAALLPVFFVLAIAIGFSLGKTISTNSYSMEQETIVESEYSALVSFDDYQSYYAE